MRGDGTGTSANGVRNQRLPHADSMSDKDCKVIGGSRKENGVDRGIVRGSREDPEA